MEKLQQSWLAMAYEPSLSGCKSFLGFFCIHDRHPKMDTILPSMKSLLKEMNAFHNKKDTFCSFKIS